MQWADTQNEQLHQALHNLESEREDLNLRLEALQEDSQLRMEHISAMEGTDFAKGRAGWVMAKVSPQQVTFRKYVF